MKKLIVLTIVTLACIASPAQADTDSHGNKVCNQTATGWTITPIGPTSCPFARSVYKSVKRYQQRHSLSNNDRFVVRAKSRKMWCSVVATEYVARIFCQGNKGVAKSSTPGTMFEKYL